MTSSLPLMGIENSLYRLTHTRQAIYSLPLMGIENRRFPAVADECAGDSLPLMGIENDGNRSGDNDRGLLITPHGDRKPPVISAS